ncbi:hypothetical protein ACLB0R_03805 [Sphingomonas sp. GlSt437]|uniref:hypothetical protein n=1 Tax=Sphingomonas sp. GlSt437 TaxID=3389970 RepID=UPI003A854DF8
MNGPGRPLRFLGAVLGGWIGLRVVMLWPAMPLPALAARHLALVPPASAAIPTSATPSLGRAERAASLPPPSPASIFEAPAPQLIAASLIVPDPPFAGLVVPARRSHGAAIAGAMLGLTSFGTATALPSVDIAPIIPLGISANRLAKPGRTATRWRASFWLFARGGSEQGGLSGGTLGGDQAGARVGYLVDSARRLTIYGRVSSALAHPQAEAAFGADWQPTRLPIHLIAEDRVPLQQGLGGPALGVIAGAGPLTVVHNFRLEAYGQAGVILRNGGVGFADGAARLDRPVAKAGAVRLSLGGGVWGAIQPDAARIDLGPALTADLPIKTHQVRLSLDWRERVAGGAHPVSGPAITLGADF